jgi:hypothetical protein
MLVAEDFVLREIHGRNLLIPFRRNNISPDPIFLNSVGAEIWKRAPGALSQEALVDEVVALYELTDREDIASVEEFVEQMTSMGLINAEVVHHAN